MADATYGRDACECSLYLGHPRLGNLHKRHWRTSAEKPTSRRGHRRIKWRTARARLREVRDEVRGRSVRGPRGANSFKRSSVGAEVGFRLRRPTARAHCANVTLGVRPRRPSCGRPTPPGCAAQRGRRCWRRSGEARAAPERPLPFGGTALWVLRRFGRVRLGRLATPLRSEPRGAQARADVRAPPLLRPAMCEPRAPTSYNDPSVCVTFDLNLTLLLGGARHSTGMVGVVSLPPQRCSVSSFARRAAQWRRAMTGVEMCYTTVYSIGAVIVWARLGGGSVL